MVVAKSLSPLHHRQEYKQSRQYPCNFRCRQIGQMSSYDVGYLAHAKYLYYCAPTLATKYNLAAVVLVEVRFNVSYHLNCKTVIKSFYILAKNIPLLYPLACDIPIVTVAVREKPYLSDLYPMDIIRSPLLVSNSSSSSSNSCCA